MEIIYLQQALNDLKYWKKSGNKVVQKRITQLIESIEITPFEGIGKPEGLKYHHFGNCQGELLKNTVLFMKLKMGRFLSGH